MIIGYKDFLYNENTLDDTIEMSIQFSMHIDQEEWYVASWLQKRDYAIVRIYSDTRAKRLDWYRYRLTNHIKDDEIIEEQHFHVYSDIRPDLQLLKRVCEMFAREKYIIQKGIVPDITYEMRKYLYGYFLVPEKKVVMYIGGENLNTLYIKALGKADINKNKFRPAVPFGENGEIELDSNKFRPMMYINGINNGIDIDKNKFSPAILYGLNGEIELDNNEFKPMVMIGDNRDGISPDGNWQFTIETLIRIGDPGHTMFSLYPTEYRTMTTVGDGVKHMIAIKNSISLVFNMCNSLTKIQEIENMSSVKYMDMTFANCYSLPSIPLLDTSNVTNMNSMCSGCKSLSSFPSLNTSKVVDMGNMFQGCSNLSSIPLLDTSNVRNMASMFSILDYGITAGVIPCGITTIPSLDTSNVTNMNSMFLGCTKLKTVPSLNTSKVKDMDHMFAAKWTSDGNEYNCKSLISVGNLDLSSVESTMDMFGQCTALTSIGTLANSSNDKNMAFMFSGCISLTTTPALDTSSVTNMAEMFDGDYSLTSIGTLSDTSKVTDMSNMFLYCSKLKTIPYMDTSNVLTFTGLFPADYYNNWRIGSIFYGCSSLSSIPWEIDLSSIPANYKIKGSAGGKDYTYLPYENMFYGCSSLSNVKFKNVPPDFDVSKLGISSSKVTIVSKRSS